MSNGLKRTLRYSAIILGLVVVALLVAPFFIDVNKYRDQISHAVEDATGRKLSIGAMQASLFPWIGVRLEDVHLANRAGFADRDFASIKSLDVRLELMPLFSGRYEIKRFELDQPEIYLERHADGETNWGDLAGGTPAAGGEQAAAPAPAASPDKFSALAGLQAQTISLTNGAVTWADQQGGLNLTLTDLGVRLDDVQLKRPIGVEVTGKLGGDPFKVVAQVGPLGDLAKFDAARLPVKGELTVDHLGLKNFKAQLAGWPALLGPLDAAAVAMDAKLEQRSDGLRLGEGSVTLEAAHKIALQWKADMQSADRVELRRSQIDMDGRKLAEMHGDIDKLGSESPTYQLRLASEPIDRLWLAGLLPDLKTLYAGHPAPWKQIKVGMLLAGTSDQLDLRDLQLLLDGELVQASGSVFPDKNGPNIRLRIATNDLHIDPWLPQAQQQPAAVPVAPVAGTAATNETEPDLRFLKDWRVAAQVQAGTLHLRGLDLQNLRMTVNGVDGKFDLNPLRFGLSSGQVEEKASLNAAAYPARWTESVHITGVQVGPVLKAVANLDMLEGELGMDTDFSGTGLSQSAVKTLGGHGSFTLRDGKVRGFDIAGTLRRLANPLAATGPQETDFSQLSGSFKVTNGVARNDDLFMSSPLLRVTGKGTVDLVQKSLDYHVKPTVVGTLVGQGDTVAVRQGFSVPLHITGSFAAPKVQPELDAATILQNLQGGGGGGGGGKVGGVIGQILQGSQQQQTPQQQQPAQPQQTPQQQQPAPATPQKQLQKSLEGLIKGL